MSTEEKPERPRRLHLGRGERLGSNARVLRKAKTATAGANRTLTKT